uniref:Uncharacterized protein n=1 Tax=Anguilla anguilla TaxID=7936 RepID=A0A0E9RP00_ANGAN
MLKLINCCATHATLINNGIQQTPWLSRTRSEDHWLKSRFS